MARIIDCLGHWRVPPSSELLLQMADAVATHEFGDQRNVSVTTRQIVELGVLLARRYKLPLICQSPGDSVAKHEGLTPFAVIKEHLLRPGTYLDTDEVNRQIAEICHKETWQSVILVTHPHHLWRAGENLELHAVEAVYPDVSSVTYDKSCPRVGLRSPAFFVPRELYARALYLKRGWL